MILTSYVQYEGVSEIAITVDFNPESNDFELVFVTAHSLTARDTVDITEVMLTMFNNDLEAFMCTQPWAEMAISKADDDTIPLENSELDD